MSLSNKEREHIIVVAESWYGTPFYPHACLKGCGVDCAQFLAGVYREAGYWCGDGIVLPAEYSIQIGQHSSDSSYIDIIQMYMREISEAEVKSGDVVIYWVGLAFSHAAIIKSWPDHIIHALERGGVTAGHGMDSNFRNLQKKFFSLRDVHCKGAV